MLQPHVELIAGETLTSAEAKVEQAFEEAGAVLLAYDNLNTYLPISSVCHFYQATVGRQVAVIVVMVGAWDEKTVLTCLNVLLEIRMDPDPPGRLPVFRFYSVQPVPPVLLTLFGDQDVCEFECRAMLVAQFGKELPVRRALQFATACRVLVRETLGVELDMREPDVEERIARVIEERLREAKLPQDGAPLNGLILLGFLFGERLRLRFPYGSQWVKLEDVGPWPVVAFGAASGRDTETEPAPAAVAVEGAGGQVTERGRQAVVFNPIGTVVSLYQNGNGGQLDRVVQRLGDRLRAELEPAAEPR